MRQPEGGAVRTVKAEALRARVAALEREVAALRQAEKALADSEARNRAILQTASVGIVIVDAAGRIVQINARAEELFGFRREELLGQTVEVLLPEPIRAGHVAHRAAYLADPRVRQMGPGRDLVARRKDGSIFPVEIGLSFADTDGGRLVIAFISDITERKRAERRLRTGFAVTQVLAEGLPLADVTPRLLSALCECLGWEFGELWRVDSGANVLRWEGCWHSPALESGAFTALSRELTFAPGVGIPGRVWTSGQPVWVPEITEEACFLRAAAARRVGIRAACAFPIRRLDRVTAVAVFFSRETLQPDADLLDLVGDVATRIGLYIEYRRAQEDFERQREMLHQQEKLAALGTLAAGLAHEVNNPMAVIASRVECMLMEAGEQGLSETARGDLQVIGKHADRVARITQGLLSLSRHQVWQLSPVDLNSIVEEALLLMEKQLARERVALERDLAPGLPAVLGSASHLEQVILNLLTNAREAMPEGGRLRVATRREGGAVEVEVTDAGKGIPAEHLSKVFDPFFTTKEKGTGLGLSISYGIVRDHGGNLTVRSREGEGSTFLVSLPVAGER